jgi:hypothetical protein
MTFSATCVPGAKAVAAVQFLGEIQHQPAVVIDFDPDRLILGAPRCPGDLPAFLRFLRHLVEAVDDLAEQLDPLSVSEYYQPTMAVVAARPPGIGQ